MFGYGIELRDYRLDLRLALPLVFAVRLAQCLDDNLGNRTAGGLRQLLGEPARLRVLDVQGHPDLLS